jgi:hypothetical protein
MKLRVLQGFVGKDRFTYIVGQTVDFDEARAAALIEQGLAEEVATSKIEVTAKSKKAAKVTVRKVKKDGQ